MKDGRYGITTDWLLWGGEAEWNFHNWFGAVWHRFLNFIRRFPSDVHFFFVGTIFSALTVIPAFSSENGSLKTTRADFYRFP